MKWCFAFVLACLASSAVIPVNAGEPESVAGATPAKPLDYMIVVTGGELLEGAYPDAHTPYITRTLRQLGARCVGVMLVDDEREPMQRALAYATNKAPLVIVTGGLGPTPNDITRETIADFTGIALHEDPVALADMEKRFNQRRDHLRPNLRRQTQVPVRGGWLKNAAGTAVGLIFDSGANVIVALPGPPRELQPMVRDELAPWLRSRFGVRAFGCSLTLRFVGAGQSLIDQTIKDHVAVAPDVVITSLFEASRVDFTFSLPGNTTADQERLRDLASSIREHLGEYIYAEGGETLEDVVVRKLAAQGGPLVLAEIGSSGHLGSALQGATGSERLLAGAYCAPSLASLRRLLKMAPAGQGSAGQEQAMALAKAAMELSGSKRCVAVGPVEIDQGNVKNVWVAFKPGDEDWKAQRLTIREAGEIHRSNLVTQILDWLRRQ